MREPSRPVDLSSVMLFQGLTAGELALVARVLRREACPEGRILFTAEQPGGLAYIVTEGAVKVYIDGMGDRQVTLAVLGVGEVVGEMSLADSLARSASVVTIEPSVLLRLSGDHFRELLLKIPVLNHNLARILSRRLRLANAQIQSLAALDVFGRVARQLLTFAQEYGEPAHGTPRSTRIPFRLTQSDLADLVGASRGSVNEVMVTFKDHSYISVDARQHIVVRDKEALLLRCM